MNDILTTSNSVYCAFVAAKRVGATIEQIDTSAALACKGVVAFFGAKDIPGVNSIVTVTRETPEAEELFVAGSVKFYDQPLGVIAALTQDAALYAATLVEVTYARDQKKVFPTINQVLAEKKTERIVCLKNMEQVPFKMGPIAPGDVEGMGIFQMESQYHFTMEPQTTIAVPLDNILQVYSSTQWMDGTQGAIAHLLGMNVNSIQLQVRRVGGGYGAKVTRGNVVACAAALVAAKLKRPARFVQTIESMMEVNGKRWACRSDYEFRARASGSIIMLTNNYYEDAGCSLNESPVDFLTLPALKNVYNLADSNFRAKGSAILTDAPSSTWCRAPGSAEGW